MLDLALAAQALLQRQTRDQTGRADSGLERGRVRHFEHEIHAATVRMFERRGPEATAWAFRFLQHEMNVATDQIRETLLGPFEPDFEPDDTDVELEGSLEIAHVEFGDENGFAHLRSY